MAFIMEGEILLYGVVLYWIGWIMGLKDEENTKVWGIVLGGILSIHAFVQILNQI